MSARASFQYERSSGLGTNGERGEEEIDADVAVVGAGIVGISIAQTLLKKTKLSVALIDSARPCGGATGAGQGYIWMGHRTPGTPGWELALRGKTLWEEILADLDQEGSSLGWKTTGSLLVAHTPEEASALRRRAEILQSSGIEALFLDATSARATEPSLAVPDDGGALLVPQDSQIDAELAVEALLKVCRQYGEGPHKRYYELFEEPVHSFIKSPSSNEISGISTGKRTLRILKGTVVAAGVWSTGFMATALKEHEDSPVVPLVKPRKGHLLVLEGLPQIVLNHGLMEAEYTANYSSPSKVKPTDIDSKGGSKVGETEGVSGPVAVSFTATTDAKGRLLIGSSREFSGFGKSVTPETISAIVKRASKFLPALGEDLFVKAIQNGTVRTGLRPYVQDGRPLIGPIPTLPNLFIATGHEGSGLCMALATAEIIESMLTGSSFSPVDPTPFLPIGRLTTTSMVETTSDSA